MLTVKVNSTQFGVVHKGSLHLAKNTAPDVCKTPSPGGPVPIPYPVIISLSSDLANGTTTVKADGGNMIAVKGCEYAMCTGDEAGTAGGVVSNTFKKEAKFILFSFDVKMDGKNACRLGDKMTMNHQNTVCMMGTTPTAVVVTPAEKALQKMVCDCDKKKRKPGESCRDLGTRKHDCVDEKIKEHNSKGKTPRLGNEAGWTSGRPPDMIPFSRSQTFQSVRAGTDWPDACSFDANGDPEQVFDFKFKCPPAKGKPMTPWGRKSDGRSQEAAYRDLTRRWGKDPNQFPPTRVSNTNCP